jgi:phosphatidate cytidylyltransferase
MNQRTLTVLVVAPIAVALVMLVPTPALAVLTTAMSLAALWEWSDLLGIRSPALRALILLAAAAVLLVLWWLRDTQAWWYVIGIGLAWWIAALVWLGHFDFAAGASPGARAIKLAAGALAVVPAWVALLAIHRLPVHGHAWALFALALVWAADIAAYLAGSRYGTTRLAPRISPGKTTAGVQGALVGSFVVALIGGWLLGERGSALVALLAIALASVAASIIGDLFESLLKRQAGVKDSGTLFPGHGGLLDRLDSVFAALPVFAAGKLLLDLVVRP